MQDFSESDARLSIGRPQNRGEFGRVHAGNGDGGHIGDIDEAVDGVGLDGRGNGKAHGQNDNTANDHSEHPGDGPDKVHAWTTTVRGRHFPGRPMAARAGHFASQVNDRGSGIHGHSNEWLFIFLSRKLLRGFTDDGVWNKSIWKINEMVKPAIESYFVHRLFYASERRVEIKTCRETF